MSDLYAERSLCHWLLLRRQHCLFLLDRMARVSGGMRRTAGFCGKRRRYRNRASSVSSSSTTPGHGPAHPIPTELGYSRGTDFEEIIFFAYRYRYE